VGFFELKLHTYTHQRLISHLRTESGTSDDPNANFSTVQ